MIEIYTERVYSYCFSFSGKFIAELTGKICLGKTSFWLNDAEFYKEN